MGLSVVLLLVKRDVDAVVCTIYDDDGVDRLIVVVVVVAIVVDGDAIFEDVNGDVIFLVVDDNENFVFLVVDDNGNFVFLVVDVNGDVVVPVGDAVYDRIAAAVDVP